VTQKYFLDERNIFDALFHSRLTVADIADHRLYLGDCADGVANRELMPIFLLAYNTTKPTFYHDDVAYVSRAEVDENIVTKPTFYHDDVAYVSRAEVDENIVRLWEEFRTLAVRLRDEGRLTFSDGKNYPHKALSFLKAGNEVYWAGAWRTLAELKYLEAEK
jgi:hypothetical protein